MPPPLVSGLKPSLWESPRVRFFIAFVPPFVLSALYWPIMLLTAPTGGADDAARWVINNPAISVIQMMLIPLCYGILLKEVNPVALYSSLPRFRLLIPLVFLVVLAIGVWNVCSDSSQAMNDRVIEPLEFRKLSDRQFFLEKDRTFRAVLATNGLVKYNRGTNAPLTNAWQVYIAYTSNRFLGAKITLAQDGSVVSWWQ